MLYKILADLIVAAHFAWILFMLFGFALTAWAVFCVYVLRASKEKWNRFFDRYLFRTIHVAGIAYVGSLAFLGKYCPVTIFENFLRARYDPDATYPGSFIVHHIERLVYPNVNPMTIVIPTVIVAAFTLIVYVLKPPKKIRELLPDRPGTKSK